MDLSAMHQKDYLMKHTTKRCLILLLFLLLLGSFGIRLAMTESPEDWKEVDVTIADIQHISRKPNRWQLTDTEGNTYFTSDSYIVANHILPHNTYRIVYAPQTHNHIRALSQGDIVIIDYAHSVSVHGDRDIWDWLLASIGLAGAVTTIVCMIMDIRKLSNKK